MMTLLSHEKIYLWVSVVLMCAGVMLFLRNLRLLAASGTNNNPLKFLQNNSIVAAWFFLVVPNFLMVVVYLVENSKTLWEERTPSYGASCNFYAFCAVCSIVCSNGSTITIAYFTYKLVTTAKLPHLKYAIVGNLLSWITGLFVALLLLFFDSFGPYQKLYCCVTIESYRKLSAPLVFTIFSVSICSQTFLYSRSYQSIKMDSKYVATQSPLVSGSKSAIMQRGFEMVSVFYFSWFLVFLDAALVYSGNPPNVWASITAAWMAKMEPIWHCSLIHNTLKRIMKRRGQKLARVSPALARCSNPSISIWKFKGLQTNFTSVSKGPIAGNVKTLLVAQARACNVYSKSPPVQM